MTTHRFRQMARAEHFPARIADQIRRDIAAGRLTAGDRLPTELKLSEMFGVSRTVVREAIAQLRNEGLVESRQGVGAFVVDADKRRLIQFGTDSLTDPEHFRSLFQLRVPLEIEAAGLAALHHDASQLQKLDAAQLKMEGRSRWGDEWIEADLEFHTVLAMATGNEYFSMFLGFIGGHLSQSISAGRIESQLEDIVDVTLAEHAAIRDAIAQRDPIAAREAMRTHITNAAGRLKLELQWTDQKPK